MQQHDSGETWIVEAFQPDVDDNTVDNQLGQTKQHLCHAEPDHLAKLQTLPGIGLVTALWIVGATLNFTRCSSTEQATASAGLAPMPPESGTRVHKRPCIGHTGNGRLRTALSLATLSAARYKPVLKPFYDRLRAAGKQDKVARCAAARKLLHLAFADGTHLEDVDPTYQLKHKQRATGCSFPACGGFTLGCCCSPPGSLAPLCFLHAKPVLSENCSSFLDKQHRI